MKSILMVLKKNKMRFFNIFLLLLITILFLALNLAENNISSDKVISPEWNQFSTVSRSDSLTQGITWTGELGITLTVDQIMEKEAMLPSDYYPKPNPERNRDLDEEDLPQKQQNPNAPDVSQWPPRNEEQKKSEPPQSDNPQTIGTSFVGPTISNSSGYIPPDSQGDVGPTQVMVCSNGRIQVFSKAGVLGALNSDIDVFFSSVDNGTGISDPHIRYDRLSARWYIVCINLPASGANRILIARSSGATITGTASFTFFQFQQDLVGTPGIDAGGFADYPTLGVDKFALYIGANMFNPVTNGTTAWVINKANLIAGTLTVTPFRALSTTSIEGPQSPQGVDNDDPSATEGYIIGPSSTLFSKLIIRRIVNPGGTPSISANLGITVPATVYPEDVPHNGSSVRLDALDDRLYAAEIHKNKITGAVTLWTAHNIEVNASGVASSSGSRDAGRWYEITNLTSTPALNQSGTLFDPTVASPRYYWIPSVVMSGQGHMALGCSSAGIGKRAEIYAAGKLRTDANGTTQSSTLAQSSSTGYSVEGGSQQRWGDYSQTVVDPNDDMTIWTFQEYCNTTNSWGVRAIKLIAPPPATPVSSNVTNILAEQPSVNIIITGTSSSGSEFFDPGADAGGPGYSNHIASNISGGVTVNSITFNSPTQVTLNISTVGSPAGLKNITITNPDGQSSSGNNLINILPISSDTLNLTSLVQGFYDASTNQMVRDTMRVYLRNSLSPYASVDSGSVYLTGSGTGTINFPNTTTNGVNYYLQLIHRNSIETWSSSPGQSFTSSILNYDFTTANTQAFGNNMKNVDNTPVSYAIYSGDVDRDGAVDLADLTLIDNDAYNFISGYVNTDLNGDNNVDISDGAIADNNAFNFVIVVKP